MISDLSNKNLWKELGKVKVNKYETLKFYGIQETKLFSLYAEASYNGVKMYDAELQDFALKVFFIIVEKIEKGTVTKAMQFLAGVGSSAVRTAYNALSKNYLDFCDDLSRAEIVLEAYGIPYVKGIDYTARSYVRGKIKVTRPELRTQLNSKGFKIDVTAEQDLLKTMLTDAHKLVIKESGLEDNMFPNALLESAVAKTTDK